MTSSEQETADESDPKQRIPSVLSVQSLTSRQKPTSSTGLIKIRF